MLTLDPPLTTLPAPPAQPGLRPAWRWVQGLLARAIVRPFRVERALLWRGETPARRGLRGERVELAVAPGIVLRGWLTEPSHPGGGPARGTVVLFHGVSSCKEATLPLAGRFGAAGYRCLTYDGRGHGDSGGRWCTYGYHEKEDLSRWLDWLETRLADEGGPGPVAVWGTSMGGAVALQAMAADRRVACGIAESTFATLREVAAEYARRLGRTRDDRLATWALAGAGRLADFDPDAVRPEETARGIDRPVFLLHGTADDHIVIQHGRRIFDRLPPTPGNRWLPVEGGGHYGLWHAGGEPYVQAQVEFLETHCR